eukprot:3934635-Rhodomonas_salina.3
MQDRPCRFPGSGRTMCCCLRPSTSQHVSNTHGVYDMQSGWNFNLPVVHHAQKAEEVEGSLPAVVCVYLDKNILQPLLLNEPVHGQVASKLLKSDLTHIIRVNSSETVFQHMKLQAQQKTIDGSFECCRGHRSLHFSYSFLMPPSDVDFDPKNSQQHARAKVGHNGSDVAARFRGQ